MEKLKLLVKNFLLAGSGNILGQLLGFFVIAYLGRVLGPKGYGIFNFAQAYVYYFYILTDLGLSLYCVKQTNQLSDDSRIFREVFSLRFILSILCTVIYLASVYFIQKTTIEKNSLYLIGISVFFTGIFIDSFFTAKNNMKYSGVAQFLKNAIFYILCVLFVHDQSNVGTASIAFSLGTVGASIYLIFRFKSIYKLRLLTKPKKDFYTILKTAFPLAFSLLMIQINNNFDIIYLSFFKDQRIVGLYSAAYKIVNFLIAVLVIYFNASYGTIAELIKNDRNQLNKFISSFFKIGILFVTPITLGGITLSSQIMTFIYGDNFKDSGLLFALLIPLVMIRMITSTYSAVLIMADKSTQLSKAVAIGALINIIFNILLVPRYDAVGSALATLICETIQGFLLYLYYKRICSSKLIKYSFKPIFISFLMSLVIFIVHVNLLFSVLIGVLIYFILYSITDLKFTLFVIRKINNKS